MPSPIMTSNLADTSVSTPSHCEIGESWSELEKKPGNQPTDNSSEDSVDACLRELAELSPIEYDQQREAKADELGVRVSTLDIEVNKYRSTVISLSEHGCDALLLCPAEIARSGKKLHRHMSELVQKYIYLCDSRMADIIALWCLYTHGINSFRIAPKMLITAPGRACGKSTLLEVIAALSCRCEALVGISPAVVYRIIEAHRPTLAFDEVDNMRNSPGYDEITAIMNAGHKRGTYVWRCDGDNHEPRKFFLFGPQVIAMIGEPKDTTASRSIVIELGRANAAESQSLEDISDIDPLTDWEPLRSEALKWAIDHKELLEQPAEIPIGVHGRHRDNWRPLLRVAEVIGDDELIELARTMCIETAQSENSRYGFNDRLMVAIASQVADYTEQHPNEKFIHTKELFDRIRGATDVIPEGWGPARLSRLLSTFKCSAMQCRALGIGKRGYSIKSLRSVIDRYAP